jgi:hypothetical protein
MSTLGTSPIPEPADWDEKSYLFSVEYKKRDDDARHYSNIRSALTSFLITVGLTLLSAYFSKDHVGNRAFFMYTGFTVLLAAVASCLVFSWRTQRSAYHMRELWHWVTLKTKVNGGSLCHEHYPDWRKSLPISEWRKLWWRMAKDAMNWALILAVGAIATAFYAFADHSDTVSQHCAHQTVKCTDSCLWAAGGSANPAAGAQAYAIAISSSAAAAQAYAEAAAIARDAAKTYADSTKAGGGTCCCAITVNCGESCPKKHSR